MMCTVALRCVVQLCALCEKKRVLALNSGAWLSGFKGPLPKRAVRAVAPVAPHLPKLMPPPKRSESGSGATLVRDRDVSSGGAAAATGAHAAVTKTLSGGRKLSAPGSLALQPAAQAAEQREPQAAAAEHPHAPDAPPAAQEVPVQMRSPRAPEATQSPVRPLPAFASASSLTCSSLLFVFVLLALVTDKQH